MYKMNKIRVFQPLKNQGLIEKKIIIYFFCLVVTTKCSGFSVSRFFSNYFFLILTNVMKFFPEWTKKIIGKN